MVILRRWSEWIENGYVTEVITLMEGKWSVYRGGQFFWKENGRYRGGQYILPLNLLILGRWSWREKGHVIKGGHARGGGGLYACKNRESMVMLWRLSL